MSRGLSLITGGAGFIGTNLAHRLLSAGESVRILDNLSRPSVTLNVEWLRRRHKRNLEVRVGDVRDAASVTDAVRDVDCVFHLAAQVAVTTSLLEPLLDFDVNARGTLNVLEAVRKAPQPSYVFFTSTNKVYGALGDIDLQRTETRYEPRSKAIREHGISEQRPLDLYSPYGCSKGSADQYVLDYGRTYGIPTVAFRMSCIYGPRQFGTEDQGWLAHFFLRAMRGQRLSIYGDGLQVRDALYVDDLVDAFMATREARLVGRAFNVGGGPSRTLSLLELLKLMTESYEYRPEVAFFGPRVGDQRYYVSDTRRLTEATGWRPRTNLEEGTAHLHGWLKDRALRANAAPSSSTEERV
jgi:CDP-paratose 2-epimerase